MCNLCRAIRNSCIEVGCVWLWVGDIGYGDDGKILLNLLCLSVLNHSVHVPN